MERAASGRACVAGGAALPAFTRSALRSSVGAALRRGGFAGGGAQHEVGDNPKRDLVEDDPGQKAQEKRSAGG